MEEEEVLTLTTFPALYFARDLNSASVVNADAYDARDRDEGARWFYLEQTSHTHLSFAKPKPNRGWILAGDSCLPFFLRSSRFSFRSGSFWSGGF